ncbi:hypothetical protein Dda_0526 [Drechslerella dactyloides]|uniref:Uncharacterized protein n=1 Tax=Drechslerella dactyloides TaxID=74499 RepID=A0AAD6J526_DREDA|nr:hypothetical protein Dda_0526 [Drechslerella dactyloides]
MHCKSRQEDADSRTLRFLAQHPNNLYRPGSYTDTLPIWPVIFIEELGVAIPGLNPQDVRDTNFQVVFSPGVAGIKCTGNYLERELASIATWLDYYLVKDGGKKGVIW